MASLIEEEIARLKLDFAGCCKVIWNQGSYQCIVILKLKGPSSHPLQVRFALLDTYPNSVPDITVRNDGSIRNEEAVSQLQEDLTRSAENMLGSPMLVLLASQASSWILDTSVQNVASIELGKPKGEVSKAAEVKTVSSDEGQDSKLPPLRTAADVIARILWDTQVEPSCVTVGYLDRFAGLIEGNFKDFCWDQHISAVDNDTLAMPRRYFKYKDVKIWDKNDRLDLVFGSTGSQLKLYDFLQQIGHSKTEEEKVDIDDNDATRWKMDWEVDDADIDYASISEGIEGYKNVNRPNFFFGIRITDKTIREKAESLIDKITSKDARLSACALSTQCLHVTLATLRLDGELQIMNAVRLLQNLQPSLRQEFPQPIVLTLDKLDHFYGNVLFVKVVKPNTELMRLAEYLRASMQSGGLRIVDVHSFSPHMNMTIMKINRPTQRLYGLPRTIDSYLYQPFKNEYFGQQTVSDLFLCPIAADRQSDGFYQTVMEMSL